MTRVTLTFDNGPEPDVTPRVLDALRERGLQAHFFVLGKLIAGPAGQALVGRARDEGHLVGNHSYTHAIPLGRDPRPGAVEAEIVATEALLAPLGLDERRFRPFGGGGAIGPHLLRADAVEYLRALAYTCVLWNSVPRDWEDPIGWPARALADCASRPHTVLVLHDVANACLAGLPAFLDEARGRGVEFTLDLPDDCVPLRRGLVTGDLSPLVADRAWAERAGAPSERSTP
ncbi:MAG: polysaccharide deacetylase family protein [Polyangiaceae bacterium]|nr:polysaccharide deacetylase family protein [Polyangiaceae bacterium]